MTILVVCVFVVEKINRPLKVKKTYVPYLGTVDQY